MRGSLAGFIVALALAMGTSLALAEAETVVAKDSAKVYLKPGEASKVVVKVKSGQEMTVLRRDGRWLKVRVAGRTGFIPRTKVSGGEDGEGDQVERQTRRRPYVDGRSTDRGWGGEPPEDRRGVDAVENVDPDDPPPTEDRVAKEPREPKEPREVKEPKEPGERLSAKEPKEPRSAKEPKEPREVKEPKAPKEPVVADDPPVERPSRQEPDEGDSPDGDLKAPKRERVRLASGTQLRAKPGAKSKKVATVEAGEYFLIEERNGWARIESDDGERGWVSAKLLGGDGAPGVASKRIIAVGAKIGFTSITQGTRTAGGAKGIPDNYNLSTSGVSANLGGAYLMPLSKGKFLVGGELGYSYVKALPGIVYMGKTTGITTHNLDLRGVGGYNIGTGLGVIAWGRLGFHYDNFAVASVGDLNANTAKLPSESLTGVTLGASATMATVTPKLGAVIAFDALLAGSRSQTKNLEDGGSPSASAIWFLLGGNYRLRSRTNIDFGYRLAFVDNAFGAPMETSKRGHTGTNVTRVDVSHNVLLGVTQSF
jgi:SH3-like domain-containing protein